MATALVVLLQQENYDVDHMADGVSTLLALESGIYDLAILDVMIPQMNGFEVARRARRKGMTIPILRALGRRSTNFQDSVLHFGDITLDTSTATLSCDVSGQSVRLAEKELRILEYMMTSHGRIMTRDQLALKIWGFESDAEYNNVEVYMSFTRKRLALLARR